MRGWRAGLVGLAIAAACPSLLAQPAELLAPLLAQPAAPLASLLAGVQDLTALAAVGIAPARARIVVMPGTLDPRLRLAPCSRIEPYLPSSARPWGRTQVGLRCLEGPKRWNVYLPVTVSVIAPAVVAAVPLAAGTVIEASHLVVADVDWAAEASSPHASPENLVGRIVARPLTSGDTLRAQDLKSRQWFAAGEVVRIVASGTGFSISGEGQAITPGLEGQTARVRTESGRIVTGQPIGERRLAIAL